MCRRAGPSAGRRDEWTVALSFVVGALLFLRPLLATFPLDLRDDLDAAGFVQRLGAHRIFMTLPTAVGAYAEWYAREHGERPPGVARPPHAM